MPGRIAQPGEQHPEEWRRDLNPDAGAGQNTGAMGEHTEKVARTAHEFKDIHRRLAELPDDVLKQIPVLPQGSRLEQGATYLDLADSQPKAITATGDMEAGPNNCYVPKSEVDYQLWNRLVGVDNPERLGTA